MKSIRRISSILCLIISCLTTVLVAQKETFKMTPLGPNNFLEVPLDLDFGPDNYLWVTERTTGIVLRVNPANAARDQLIKIADVSSTGAQDGLLGFALSKNLLNGDPYVYLSYTYLVAGQRRQKIVRYTYSITGDDGSLSSAIVLIDNMPASNDHNSARMVFGPDNKIYYTIGDQGGNQNANWCSPILSQVIPTQAEVDKKDWTNYPGKVLRINTDGSIPADNPLFNGVRSHIYTVGHRNPQGIAFSKSGKLYSDEHGPDTDDEVNLLSAGKNYGWPRVVGYKDDQAYDYCDLSSLPNCKNIPYDKFNCPSPAKWVEESTFTDPNYVEPLMSMFAVKDDYNYNDPRCQTAYACRPNVAPSSIAVYESDAIPAWTNSLLVTSLKRGRVYRMKLNADGTAIVGDTIQFFYTQNRYRDIVWAPDGKTFYLLTDKSGNTTGPTGLTQTSTNLNPGNILKFTLNETVGVKDELEEQLNFGIYANPQTKSMVIDWGSMAPIEKALVINTSGQTVKVFTGLHDGENEVNVTELTAGVYLVRILANNRYYQKRVVLY